MYSSCAVLFSSERGHCLYAVRVNRSCSSDFRKQNHRNDAPIYRGASCNQERELEPNCAGAFPVALIQRLGYAAWSFSPSNGLDMLSDISVDGGKKLIFKGPDSSRFR
jgi:hypothetical protein